MAFAILLTAPIIIPRGLLNIVKTAGIIVKATANFAAQPMHSPFRNIRTKLQAPAGL
jgi:hypothetical protein